MRHPVLLVLATLVPLLAFSAFTVYQHGTIHRAAVGRGARSERGRGRTSIIGETFR